MSSSPPDRIRPRRRHLQAHQQVINALLAESTPLPFAFGTVVPTTSALIGLLDHHADRFVQQLNDVEGCAEFGIRVTWSAENIFAYFVDREPELRSLRDRVFATQPPRREEMVELGRLFEELRAQRRTEIAGVLGEVLAPKARAVRLGAPTAEDVAADAAVLVPVDAAVSIDEAARQLADALPDGLLAHVSGPVGPYSFVSFEAEA